MKLFNEIIKNIRQQLIDTEKNQIVNNSKYYSDEVINELLIEI